MRFSQGVGILALIGLLAGCSEREEILQGPRLDVRAALDPDAVGVEAGAEAPAAAENPVVPISLPAAVNRAEWTQTMGNAAHLAGHLALAANPTRIWSAKIGDGNSRKFRITADPVVAGGRIFTLDSHSHVMAHGLDGQPLWTADLTPPSERNTDASGGGLAFGEGLLFATSGFGALVALDPATGARVWTQKTDASVSGAPTVRDGLVYVVSRDNTAWAVRADNGRIQWQVPATPSPSGMIGGAAPAVTDRVAIFPFGSAEIAATLRKSGVRVWAASLSGQRRGRVYATVTDITGDPVVDGNVVYVGTQSGRTVAMEAAGGDRLWTADEGAYSPVVPAGGSVFLISDQSKLVRLDATTGDRIWAVDLPYFIKQKIKRRKAIFAHYGPVLAGGRLLVASDDGLIRAFSPETGALVASIELPGGAASGPVVAGGTLYVVSANGQLHAFR